MTITNHVLAGAIIGVVVKEPVAVLTLALGSHFVMDALPHFGYKGNQGFSEALKHRLSYWVGAITILTTIFIAILLIINAQWFALAAGLVAALPDALGVYNYQKYEKHKNSASGFVKYVHVKFHRAIQWCERPWGVYVEFVVFLALTWLLIMIV